MQSHQGTAGTFPRYQRGLQISRPNVEVSGSAPTNVVHVKIFKDMGQMKFHQMIILSFWEKWGVLPFLDEVVGEAKAWFLNVLESQQSLTREEMGTTGGPRDFRQNL